MPTTEFVRYMRLTHAACLQRKRPEEKIEPIAYEVGFSSPNDFSRRFREQFGRTPGAWRQG